MSAPPTHLGRYRIVSRIGRGGMAEVLRVRDDDVGRDLAAKVLANGDDRRLLELFIREARLTARLDHPNIVTVHEVGRDDDGRVFFTMPRVRGESLAEILARSDPPSLARRLEIFLRICDAVGFAHDRGIVHRDLKPANVMVGPFGEVLVMDWGLARLRHAAAPVAADGIQTDRDAPPSDEPALPSPSVPRALREHVGELGATARIELATQAGELAGTPAYMSPEAARGETDALDERTDVFGLGAILYEMLAGRAPFFGKSTEAVLAAVLRADLVPPSRRAPGRSIPWDLEAIVVRAMARRPSDRYGGVAPLRADVVRFIEGRSVGAADYRAWQRLGKWVGRHRTGVGLAAGALALLVLVGALASGRWRDARAFEGHRAAAAEAVAGQRWDDAVAAAERGLALRVEPELVRILEASRAEIAARDRADRAALADAERRRRLDELLREASARIDETRPWFHIPDAAIRDKLLEIERVLDTLEEAAADPANDDVAELHRLIGIGRNVVGDPEAAITALRRAITLAPEAPSARLALARLLLERALAELFSDAGEEGQRRSAAVLEEARSVVGGVPETPETALDLHLVRAYHAFVDRTDDGSLAVRLADEGRQRFEGELGVAELWLLLGIIAGADHASAELALAEALRRRPHFPWAFFTRGTLRMTAGKLDAALADLDAALSIHPHLAHVHLQRGVLNALRGEREAAIADYDRAARAAPDWALPVFNRGNQHLALGDLDRAVEAYTAALELDPRHRGARINRATARLRQGDPAAALLDADRAIELHPDSAAAHFTRGDTHRLLERWEDALADYDRGLELDPRSARRWSIRATLRGQLGHAQADVDADRDRALATEPETPEDFYERGRIRRIRGDGDGALADFDRAIGLDRRFARALDARATMKLDRGDLEGAVDDAISAVAACNADDPRICYNAGAIRLARGEWVMARDAFRMALFPPSRRFPEARRGLGMALARSGDLVGGLRELRLAVERKPEMWSAWNAIGHIEEEQGRPRAAIVALRKALELAPEARRAEIEERLRALEGG